MEEIGVEAVVAGLQAFESDMGRIQKTLDDLVPSGNALGGVFSWLGGVMSDFGASVMRIVETALGVLLRDAINAAIAGFQELIKQIIDAGSEFQLLSIRLNGMNLQIPINEGLKFTDAMNAASIATQEEIQWIQALATATPFDATDIANTYALARSYGFADTEARRLTKDISDYSASMGLSSASIVNIIQNLGTMDARGKITYTAIRNLTRSAFLPLDDVLQRIADHMGITVKALSADISKPGEGVPAQLFMDAFQQMIEEEPRFIGAAGRLGKSFSAASNNVIDLWRNIGGAKIVMPILDSLGSKISTLVDEFVTFDDAGNMIKTEKWDALSYAAARVGFAIQGILKDLLGMLPSTSDLADMLIKALDNIALWLAKNKNGIVQWVKDAIANFKDFRDRIGEAIDTVSKKFDGFMIKMNTPNEKTERSKWDDIVASFDKLSSAVDTIITKMTGLPAGADFIDTFVNILTRLADWVTANQDSIIKFFDDLGAAISWISDNREAITTFLTSLIQFFILVQIFQMISSLVIGIVISVVSFIAAIVGIVGVVVVVVEALASFAGAIVYAIGVVAALAVALVGLWLIYDGLKVIFTAVGTFLAERFTSWLLMVVQTTQKMADAFLKKDWKALGIAMIDGLIEGIKWNTVSLVKAIVTACVEAFNAAKSYMGVHSPSKLYAGLGKNMMLGISQGIEKHVGGVVGTMESAVSAMTMPAMLAPAIASAYASPMTSQVTNNTTQNNILNIHTNARSEPIIQDFNMLRSLSG